MTPTQQKETPASESSPGRHHVNIHVKDEGDGFDYAHPDGKSAAQVVVRKGDRVKWHCTHGNYSVLFKEHSPFSEIAFHGRRGHETAEAVVVGDNGSYHYAVTVSSDGKLVVDDPEIIVDNGENTSPSGTEH